jgi:hypothetical protein
LESALEPFIRKFTIQAYKAQVALRERMIDSLVKEFERESITVQRKAKIARQWNKTLKEKHTFQFLLDLLERQEKEEKQINKSGVISFVV